MQEGTS